MADASGVLSKMGYVDLATWGTAWAAATVACPFLSESLTSAFDRIANDTLEASGGRRSSAQGNEVIGGSTEHYLNYNTLHLFIKHIMGDDTSGTITITDELSALFLAFEFEKTAARHRFWPVKGMGFTISGEKGGRIKLTCNWAAKNFESSAVASGTDALVTNDIALFSQLRFRIADQLNAIAAGDEMGLESFEINFDRSAKADDYESNSDSSEVRQPLEPQENDFRVCGFKIKLARFDSTVAALFDAWKLADTSLMSDFYFDGTSTATALVELPNIRLTEGFDAPIGGAGVLTLEGGFDAYKSEAANPMYEGNEMRYTYTE